MKRNTKLMCVCEGAIMVAFAVVLSFLKFKIWPNGGSIDLVMIPILVFAFRRGGLWGIGAGLIFGTIKCIVSGGIGYGWQSILLDYSIAYAVVGVAGFFKNRPIIGTIAAGAVRFFVHVLSGVYIWVYMPDEFLGIAMTSIWGYSCLYNITYVLPSTILAAVAIAILYKKTKLVTRISG